MFLGRLRMLDVAILPEPSTSKKAKAAASSSSDTSTPPLAFFGTADRSYPGGTDDARSAGFGRFLPSLGGIPTRRRRGGATGGALLESGFVYSLSEGERQLGADGPESFKN